MRSWISLPGASRSFGKNVGAKKKYVRGGQGLLGIL